MQTLREAVEFLISPSMLIIISISAFVIGRFFFKISNGKCIDIVKNHLNCFRKAGGKLSVISIILYFGVPLLLAVAMAMIHKINNDVINIITIIVYILTSMFFTVLAFALDIKAKTSESSSYCASDAKIISDVLKDTYYSIMFEILASIILLIFCFIDLFASKFNVIESVIVYYMTLVILANLFIVLKKIYKVLEKMMN